MEEHENINYHIVSYFLEENKEITDPVLIKWLAEDEVNRKTFNQYLQIWNESKYYKEEESFDSGKAWIRIHTIHQKRERSRNLLKNLSYIVSGVAASFLIMIVLSVTELLKKDAEFSVNMTADFGNRSEITLPDGSIVKLNSGSDISYVYSPGKKVREVSFQGEGFFEVSKNKAPFVIKFRNGLEVKVLGTSFNLQAYADDPIVQTSLVEGSIELHYQNETLQMNTGEMAMFDKESKKLTRKEGILSHTYGWLENKLYMDNMSLADVCKHLERWYNVEITLQKELGENIHYTGAIQEETITDVMEALGQLSNIKYHIKGKQIRITSK